jgi:hypothetical protein
MDVRHLEQISAAIRHRPNQIMGAGPAVERTFNWLESVREWWSRPLVGLAAAVAILWLTVLSGFQARELRHQFKPQATAAFLLLPDARGTTTTVSSRDAGPIIVLEADLPGASGEILWDVRRAGSGEPAGEGEAAAPKAGAALKVVLPASYLPPGDYLLTVHSGADGGQSWLFHFKVV